MADILLFHHIQGLTPGMVAFADQLRAAGHTVHTPDLFEGNTFATIPEGMAYVRRDGAPDYDALADDGGRRAARGARLRRVLLRRRLRPAPRPAAPGRRGALLFESCYPITGEWTFGPWPDGVPVQVHGMDGDEFFAEEGVTSTRPASSSATVAGRRAVRLPGRRAPVRRLARCRRTTRRQRPCSRSGCWQFLSRI